MIQRIIRRVMSMILVMLMTSFIAFLILEGLPGDAATTLVGESASAEQIQTLRRQMGLDRPFMARYLDYVGGVLHGDLGKSWINDRPVRELIGERFINTLVLACVTTIFAAAAGIGIGIWVASRQGSWIDYGVMGMMALNLSLPGFGIAMLLTYLFALKLGWLPVAGGGTFAHLVLPVLTLSLPFISMVARLSRSSLLDVSQREFVLSARARGIPQARVWNRHILRNALIPVMTMVGLNCGHLLGGAFVVEVIFGWPGLGRLIVQAVFDKDFPVVLGSVLLITIIFQFVTLLIDLTHGILDPRVTGETI